MRNYRNNDKRVTVSEGSTVHKETGLELGTPPSPDENLLTRWVDGFSLLTTLQK